MEGALPVLAQLPAADEDELRRRLEALRALPNEPDGTLGWVVHVSTGRR